MNEPAGLDYRYGLDSVVMDGRYLRWLASVLAERCDCQLLFEPGDHDACLKEMETFINYFNEGDTP